MEIPAADPPLPTVITISSKSSSRFFKGWENVFTSSNQTTGKMASRARLNVNQCQGIKGLITFKFWIWLGGDTCLNSVKYWELWTTGTILRKWKSFLPINLLISRKAYDCSVPSWLISETEWRIKSSSHKN